MDIYKPFQNFQFDSFIFKTTRYKEYSRGKLLSEGYVDISILCKTQENNTIKVYLINNSLSNKILSEFEFDILFSLEDRLQLTIFPNHTNVEDILFSYLKWTIPYTREYKEFTKNEPIVGHIFTESGNIIKITFKMTEPERIIEFY